MVRQRSPRTRLVGEDSRSLNSSPCFTFKTSPCVPATRPHVFEHTDVLPVTHGDVLNVHTEALWMDTPSRCGWTHVGFSSRHKPYTTPHTHTPRPLPLHMPHNNTQQTTTQRHTTTHNTDNTHAETQTACWNTTHAKTHGDVLTHRVRVRKSSVQVEKTLTVVFVV